MRCAATASSSTFRSRISGCAGDDARRRWHRQPKALTAHGQRVRPGDTQLSLTSPQPCRPGPAPRARDRIDAQVTIRNRARIAAGLLLSLAAGFAVVNCAIAQEAESGPVQETAQGAISIPDNIQMFGKDSPNIRRPTAIVNGDIITGTDVEQRLALILAANNNKVSAEETERLRLQVLRNLIDETLEIQEAKVADIDITDADVDDAYARVATGNFHQTVPALDAYLVKVGSSSASLKRQIRGELAWQRVLRRNVQPFINVSEAEVNDLLAQLKAEKGTEEYRLGEIYLSATPETATTVEQNARRIMDQLRQGGSFVAYARQYSEASTAAVGGDLGWIRLAQLPTELANAARDLSPGQLVGPVPVGGGFSILLLIDKRQLLTADPRDAVLALKQVSINFPADTSEAEATRRAQAFADAMKTAHGCGAVDAVAAKIGAQVVANDQVRARDLPAALQTSLLKLSIGEETQPFGSLKEGVRVLMLCGRDDPKAENAPSFDELMNQMQDDRVNKRAQMYLRDLRRDAIIEYN
ncbi:MAG: peptidylprolyl isomerase [Sphingomonadales bacterium]|nr:peptidylprolyl isomerase [Sphingomonadales bacterium]